MIFASVLTALTLVLACINATMVTTISEFSTSTSKLLAATESISLKSSTGELDIMLFLKDLIFDIDAIRSTNLTSFFESSQNNQTFQDIANMLKRSLETLARLKHESMHSSTIRNATPHQIDQYRIKIQQRLLQYHKLWIGLVKEITLSHGKLICLKYFSQFIKFANHFPTAIHTVNYARHKYTPVHYHTKAFIRKQWIYLVDKIWSVNYTLDKIDKTTRVLTAGDVEEKLNMIISVYDYQLDVFVDAIVESHSMTSGKLARRSHELEFEAKLWNQAEAELDTILLGGI